MKELYSAPEAKMICFVAAENIANGIDISEFFKVNVQGSGQASVQDGDIKVYL